MNKNAIFVDPRTKLFLLLTMNIILLSFGSGPAMEALRITVGFLPFVMLLTARRYKFAIVYIGIFLLGHFIGYCVLSHTHGLPLLLLSFVNSVGTRFLPGGMMGLYFLCSTKVNEFVAAMERMHVSEKVTIPIAVMFRFFPTVWEEASSISDAMRMRKLGFRYFFRRPVEILEYRLVPLMISVVNIGEDLSASALTRCLGMYDDRTNISRCGFGWLDGFIFGMCGVLLVWYFLIVGGVIG